MINKNKLQWLAGMADLNYVLDDLYESGTLLTDSNEHPINEAFHGPFLMEDGEVKYLDKETNKVTESKKGVNPFAKKDDDDKDDKDDKKKSKSDDKKDDKSDDKKDDKSDNKPKKGVNPFAKKDDDKDEKKDDDSDDDGDDSSDDEKSDDGKKDDGKKKKKSDDKKDDKSDDKKDDSDGKKEEKLDEKKEEKLDVNVAKELSKKDTKEGGDKDKSVKDEDSKEFPSAVRKAIDTRIGELNQSIKDYKGKQHVPSDADYKPTIVKQLENIKSELAKGTTEGFTKAQLIFQKLMSPIVDMFPASLINHLATAKNINKPSEK